MKQAKTILMIFFSLGLVVSLSAATFEWEPKGDEPAFTVDVPSDWESDYLVKNNGSVVFFREDNAVIEIRSFIAEDDLEFAELMNLKAARLSARYTHVRLLNEKESRYREGLYLATWEIKEKNRTFIEKTAFVAEDDQIVSLSCISPAYAYHRYKTIFDNALLSITLSEGKKKEGQGILQLKQFQLYNRPNAKDKIDSPQTATTTTTNTSAATDVVNDLKKKATKEIKDNFLPNTK